MYYIERNAQPDVFENIGDGIWWAIITFATVGYGDIYPITPLGKLLGCIICLFGVAMVAIPTGIISSSFMSMIQKKERQQMQAEKEQEEKRQEEKHSNDWLRFDFALSFFFQRLPPTQFAESPNSAI